MSIRTVMRYTDYNADTIDLHLAIIASAGSVWWGWWKKSHEDLQFENLELLRSMTQTQPLEIGLVYRGAEEYHVAQCIEIAIAPPGSRIESPNPELTPDYYRYESHPAWFRLSRIERAEAPEFYERFGGVPKGDPTLFISDASTSSGQALSAPYEERPVWRDCKGDSILHISDMHFRVDSEVFPIQTRYEGVDRTALDEIIVRRLDELGLKIGVVVASGDFIDRGDANAFPIATRFLASLLDRMGLDNSDLVVVPGNHDVWLEDADSPTYDYRHEQPFRGFVAGLRGQGSNVDLETISWFRLSSGWCVTLVGLNSARPRDKHVKDYGYIGAQRWDPLLTRMSELSRGIEKHLKCVVFHHHLVSSEGETTPVTGRPISTLLDAGAITKGLQRHGVTYVLHGHQHIPFVGAAPQVLLAGEWDEGEGQTGRTEFSPIRLLGAGSLCAHRSELPEQMPHHSFSIYTPREDGLHVRVERFGPRTKPRCLCSVICNDDGSYTVV